jgi:NADH-quinone oxidoreductase subunit G
MRVVAGENEAINECWISDRDRFSYQGVYADDRVKSPMVKQNGTWKVVDWNQALETTVEKLKAVNAVDIGVLASPRATLEEQYLLQKVMRAIGVNNIDHRLRQVDFNDQDTVGLFPWLGMKISEIEKLDAVLLIGSNVRKEQPMINHRIRKASIKGAKVMCLNPMEFSFNYDLDSQLISDPVEIINTLAVVAKASYSLCKAKIPAGLSDLLGKIRVNKNAKSIAEKLLAAENAAVFLGNIAVQHHGYSTLRALASVIAENTGAKIGYLTGSANTAGAWLAGVVPHRKEAGESVLAQGANADEMLTHPRKVYVLLDVELEHDADNPQQAKAALNQAECVIAITPYASENMLASADVILPSAAYSETSGTYVNVEGIWQSFHASAKSFEDARPAWKILRVLGNMLDVKGFDYVSSVDVREELKQLCNSLTPVSNAFEVSGIYTNLDKHNASLLQRIGEVGEFSGDSLVRRASALQNSKPEQHTVQLNSNEVTKLGLEEVLAEKDGMVNIKQGEVMVSMPLLVNEMVPDNCALLYSGTQSSSLLGSAFGEIEITL